LVKRQEFVYTTQEFLGTILVEIVYGTGYNLIKKHFMIQIKLPSFPWVSAIQEQDLRAIYLHEKNVQVLGYLNF
jgi:hypothetical protein